MASSAQPRLSHDFLELYRSYKRKTKLAVSWLQETCKLNDVSISALVAAAKWVREQNIAVPPELYIVFKDALELRINVAQQYKQITAQNADVAKAVAVEKHDYFIAR